jgi:hypothetical protein
MKYGSRKFVLCVMTLISVTALVAFDLIGDVAYQTVVLGSIGAYIAGNVTQKIKAPEITS